MAFAPTDAAFPTLRGAIRPEYQSLPDAELAWVVGESLGIPAELAENWLSDVGRAISQRAPAILSGAVQGGVAGAPFGGPWGAAAGALLGGITGAISGGPPARGAAPAARAQPAGAPAAGALLQ